MNKINLEDLENPGFLRDLTYPELENLSKEIRTFLIENISKTGGHLSSNLGIVELTMAIHRNFDIPKDKLIFDVGHQSYVHKILTGRAKDFKTLRKYNGFLISDFNKSFGDIKSHELYKIIKELEQEKMLKVTKYRIYPTYEGMMLLDAILLRLFIEEE